MLLLGLWRLLRLVVSFVLLFVLRLLLRLRTVLLLSALLHRLRLLFPTR